MVEVEVKHGESLYDLSQMSGVDIEALEQLNLIDLNQPLAGGQTLVIPMTADTEREFHEARRSMVESKKASYLARRGGLSTVKSYRVRTGDSAWQIAQRHGRLPVWLMEAFNPGVDLNRIVIGETLIIPVVGDTEALDGRESSHQEPDGQGSTDPDIDEIGC